MQIMNSIIFEEEGCVAHLAGVVLFQSIVFKTRFANIKFVVDGAQIT